MFSFVNSTPASWNLSNLITLIICVSSSIFNKFIIISDTSSLRSILCLHFGWSKRLLISRFKLFWIKSFSFLYMHTCIPRQSTSAFVSYSSLFLHFSIYIFIFSVVHWFLPMMKHLIVFTFFLNVLFFFFAASLFCAWIWLGILYGCLYKSYNFYDICRIWF